MTEDPTTRIKEKWNNKPNKKTFKLKEVDLDTVKKSIKKMHKKKSECSDGLTQEQLMLINTSTTTTTTTTTTKRKK